MSYQWMNDTWNKWKAHVVLDEQRISLCRLSPLYGWNPAPDTPRCKTCERLLEKMQEAEAIRDTIAALLSALEAIVEAGRMSDSSRANYCADIARAAIKSLKEGD